MALAAGVALLAVVRATRGRRARAARRASERAARVAAMTGGDRADGRPTNRLTPAEFDPRLDLLAPVVGVVGLFGAAAFVGGDYALSLARLVVGALLPRGGDRRDAPRPLVPGAAGARA